MLMGMDRSSQPRVAFNAALLREPYSGVEVMIHETACALASKGVLPYCIYTTRAALRPIPAGDRVQVRRMGLGRSRGCRILWEQCMLPRQLRRDGAQVLHAPAYVAPLAARCPLVLTVHDLHVFTHPQFCSLANRLHYRLLLPLSLRRAAAITVYSEHVRRVLLARDPAAAARTHVIRPGVPVQFLKPASEMQRQAAQVRHHLPARYLLFVGDLAPRKNLPGVLAAFTRLRALFPDLHLVLAGAPGHGPDVSAARTGRSAGAAGGAPCDPVIWTGYVPAEDLPALYAMAEALVFPSFDEGFGLPALEAMACACPVVCSPGGAAEVCGAAALVCDPASPASIAAAVQALLDNPDLRREKIAAGLRRAAQFRWEDAVRELEALYCAVAQ